MLENFSDDDDNVGVIIFTKRDRGGIPGATEKPPFCIWIQRTMRKRGISSGEGGVAVMRRRSKKEAEEGQN